MPDANEKWVSLEEIAEYLGVKPPTIRGWLKKKDLPAYKVGGVWRFRYSEVNEWIKNQQ